MTPIKNLKLPIYQKQQQQKNVNTLNKEVPFIVISVVTVKGMRFVNFRDKIQYQ